MSTFYLATLHAGDFPEHHFHHSENVQFPRDPEGGGHELLWGLGRERPRVHWAMSRRNSFGAELKTEERCSPTPDFQIQSFTISLNILNKTLKGKASQHAHRHTHDNRSLAS